MRRIASLVVLLVLYLPIASPAKDIAGVSVPDSVTLPNNINLVLNGSGIRTKFFFDIYVGSLYLTAPTKDIQQVLSDTSSKRVSMHILYDDLAREKITSAWTEGFEDNNSDKQFMSLKARLERFNAFFPDLKKGDVIHMDYIPAMGTQVTVNNQVKGSIEGEDFNAALLKVWLGDSPADSDLKSAMMGGE